MKRAMREFESAGLTPIPAPTNYLGHLNIIQPWDKYIPRSRYLEQTEQYWHETLGLMWQTLRDTVAGIAVSLCLLHRWLKRHQAHLSLISFRDHK